MRLKDRVILVTGSTTGIGEHMARRFVAEGAKVILHGRNAERGAALVAELGPDNAAFCQGDLGNAAYPAQLAQDAVAVRGLKREIMIMTLVSHIRTHAFLSP